VQGPESRLTRQDALPVALLALPFLAAIVALRGLTRAIDTFHGTDESVYHLPTILQFARDLPTPDLIHYTPAQTPLFHLLFAVLTKVAGQELWLLRLANVAISLAAVIVLYRLLRRREHDRWSAFTLAALFGVSPYFFGISFLLLTDSLCWLLIVLALDRLEVFRRTRSPGAFGLFCLCVGLAVFTRQNAIWLLPAGALVLATTSRPGRGWLGGAAGLGLAVVPTGALMLAWGDLASPDANQGPCALCQQGFDQAISIRPVLFGLAVIAVYAIGLYGPALLTGSLSPTRRAAVPSAVAALVGLLALLAEPMRRRGELDAGWLWELSAHGPVIGGTSWVFWLLVPAGCASLVALLTRVHGDVVPVAVAICFLASTVVVGLIYQKYFDPSALLIIALAARPGDLRRRESMAGAALLGIAFVLYAATFPASRNAPPAKPVAAREALGAGSRSSSAVNTPPSVARWRGAVAGRNRRAGRGRRSC
jgi:hypothetical protein